MRIPRPARARACDGVLPDAKVRAGSPINPMTHPCRSFRLLCNPAALAVALCGALGCSGATRHIRPTPQPMAHGEVNGVNVTDLERELDETTPGSPAAADIRDGVARYLAHRGVEVAETGDYDGAIRYLRAALLHYTPVEIGQGGLPDGIAPLARAVLDAASARGDEAHALAAARVLMALHTPDPAAAATWHRIVEWGTHNRADFEKPWVRAHELSEVYKEVARIVPAPDVLTEAANEVITGRRTAAEAPPGERGHLNYDELRIQQQALHNAPADLAILYLRVGEIAEAANQVTSLGPAGDGHLAEALGSLAHGEGGADRLVLLVEQLERIDTTAQSGVCRVGRVDYPTDVRFPQCLAVEAAREEDYGLASADLEAAVALAPNDQRTLRASIEAATGWLAREVGSDDLAPGRRAYVRAAALLERWRSEYPNQLPPVATADLEETAAQLELAAGELPPARDHMERATRADPPSREAFFDLAEIAWRHGDGDHATAFLQSGLALPLRPSESDSFFRPQFTVRLGLAARESHDEARATALLTQAATAFDALARSATGHELAMVQLSRAEVLDVTGHPGQIRAALDAAMEAAPDDRDVAGRSVTFALARGMWSDARDLDRRARAQLNLDRTWQVYFGLWGMIAARMGGLTDDAGAHVNVDAQAASAGDMAAWTVRLAQRFTGAIDQATLVHYARTTGQRAEAAFYDATLRFAAGDIPGAESGLQAVVQSEVLRYFEYDMAWEMLQHHVHASATAIAPAATPTVTVTAPPPQARATP